MKDRCHRNSMIRGGAIYAPFITSPKLSRLPRALLVPNSLAVG